MFLPFKRDINTYIINSKNYIKMKKYLYSLMVTMIVAMASQLLHAAATMSRLTVAAK